MKLSDYLSEHGLSDAEFARRIGVHSRMSVMRYRRGDRLPRPAIMRKITVATNGQVTPADFYAPCPQQAA